MYGVLGCYRRSQRSIGKFPHIRKFSQRVGCQCSSQHRGTVSLSVICCIAWVTLYRSKKSAVSLTHLYGPFALLQEQKYIEALFLLPLSTKQAFQSRQNLRTKFLHSPMSISMSHSSPPVTRGSRQPILACPLVAIYHNRS